MRNGGQVFFPKRERELTFSPSVLQNAIYLAFLRVTRRDTRVVGGRDHVWATVNNAICDRTSNFQAVREIAGRTVMATAAIRDPGELNADNTEQEKSPVPTVSATDPPTDASEWDTEASMEDDQYEESWLDMSETEDEESPVTRLFDDDAATASETTARTGTEIAAPSLTTLKARKSIARER